MLNGLFDTKKILAFLNNDASNDDLSKIASSFLEYIVPIINLDLINGKVSIAELLQKIDKEMDTHLAKYKKIEIPAFLICLTNCTLERDTSLKKRYELSHALLLTVIKKRTSQENLINNINDNLVEFLSYFNRFNVEDSNEDQDRTIEEIFVNVFIDAIKNTGKGEIRAKLPSLKMFFTIIRATSGNESTTRISVTLPHTETISTKEQVEDFIAALHSSPIKTLDLTNIRMPHAALMLLIISIHKQSTVIKEVIFGRNKFDKNQSLELIEAIGLSTIEVLDLTNIDISYDMLTALIKSFSNESTSVRKIEFDKEKFEDKLEDIKIIYQDFKKYANINQYKRAFLRGLHEMFNIFTSGKNRTNTSKMQLIASLVLQINTSIENKNNSGVDYFQYYCQTYGLLEMVPEESKQQAHQFFYDKSIKSLFEIVYQYSQINQNLYRKSIDRLVSVFRTISVDATGIPKVAAALESLTYHDHKLFIILDVFKELVIGSLKIAESDGKILNLPAKELKETIFMKKTLSDLVEMIDFILKAMPEDNSKKSLEQTLKIYKQLLSGIELNAGQLTGSNDRNNNNSSPESEAEYEEFKII